MFLNGTIHYAMTFTIGEPEIQEYPRGSNQQFYAVVFEHVWRRSL